MKEKRWWLAPSVTPTTRKIIECKRIGSIRHGSLNNAYANVPTGRATLQKISLFDAPVFYPLPPPTLFLSPKSRQLAGLAFGARNFQKKKKKEKKSSKTFGARWRSIPPHFGNWDYGGVVSRVRGAIPLSRSFFPPFVISTVRLSSGTVSSPLSRTRKRRTRIIVLFVYPSLCRAIFAP